MKTALKYSLISASIAAVMIAAAPAMAEDSSVLCSVKQNYASVTANYTPGVDVKGNPVTPADVNAPAPAMLPTVRIPVTVDMAQRLSAILPPGTEMKGAVSIAEVHGDGKVFINGQDMTGPTTALCATIEKQKAAAMRTEQKAPARRVAPAEPEVAAQPVEPVIEEPIVETPIEPAIESPAVSPAPQVLQPAANPVPSPDPIPAAPEPAPAPENVTEPAPSSDQGGLQNMPIDEPAIVAPGEESQTPRPPMDPFAPAADGTIQGGAQ